MDVAEDRAHEAASCLARLYLRDGDDVLTADVSPENLAWLSARFAGLPVRQAPAPWLRARIIEQFADILKSEAVDGLARRTPELSARRVLSGSQILVLCVLAATTAIAAVVVPLAALRILVAVLSLAFVASGIFRAVLAWVGAGESGPAPPVSRQGLPSYTILIPLYREAAVLPNLAAALAALDYPGIR